MCVSVVCCLYVHLFSDVILTYRIAGTFKGENFRELVARKGALFLWRKLLQNVKTCRVMSVICLKFHGENFHGWLKNHKIRESFLPRKFSAIQYVHS